MKGDREFLRGVTFPSIKKKFDWEELFDATMFALGISLLLGSTTMFYVGFHDVDLSWNMLRVAHEYNLDYENWIDTYNTNGSYVNYDDSYMIGTNYMRFSMVGMLIAGMLIAGCLVTKRRKK